MEAILITSFIYGISSSLHCVGMCGPIVATLNIGGENKYLTNILYNLGRLWSYFFLGFFLGYLGETTNLADKYIPIQKLSAWIGAIFVILVGLSMVFHQKLSFQENFISNHFFKPILDSIKQTKNHIIIALSVGLISGLLPCGVLYPAYAMSFAGGDPMIGGLSMLSFFLGTFPGLFLFGIGFQWIKKYVQPSTISVLGILVILVGISTILLRFGHSH